MNLEIDWELPEIQLFLTPGIIQMVLLPTICSQNTSDHHQQLYLSSYSLEELEECRDESSCEEEATFVQETHEGEA